MRARVRRTAVFLAITLNLFPSHFLVRLPERQVQLSRLQSPEWRTVACVV